MPTYKHNRIKDLIITPSTEPLPAYLNTCIHKRSTENSAEDLEDKAINVADRVMDDNDPKLALDAAKATMAWLGKGAKSRTTIFANNAQVNQITDDPDKSKHILTSLADSIGLLTEGIQTTPTEGLSE